MTRHKRFGPGLLVTAAFIGPGTVTTCTLGGARFGLALLWVIVFATLATIILQEMCARLGIVTRQGLGEALRSTFPNRAARAIVAALVVSAILFGNAAFQTGNITGAVMGLEVLTGVPGPVLTIIVAAAAACLLWTGTYAIIERLLIALVCLMSAVFIATAVMTLPSPREVVAGLIRPTLPEGSLTTALALIGTTVVPYNLFLHASSVRERWPATTPVDQAIRESRVDTVLSIGLGGAITLAILVTAATFLTRGAELESAADMARQLEPLLGRWAKWFFALGLMAAGLTSAITAPLAASYATAGALGWDMNLRSGRFRFVWMLVIVTGTAFAIAFGKTPVAAIVFAQAANGLILPVVAVFLLIVVNRKSVLGTYANGPLANLLGGAVILLAAGLGIQRFIGAMP